MQNLKVQDARCSLIALLKDMTFRVAGMSKYTSRLNLHGVPQPFIDLALLVE